MDRKFNIGDRVQLSTGDGPVMSIMANDTPPYVTCKWWDKKTESFKTDAFVEEQLVAVK